MTIHSGVYQGSGQTFLGVYGFAASWAHVLCLATVVLIVSDVDESKNGLSNELE